MKLEPSLMAMAGNHHLRTMTRDQLRGSGPRPLRLSQVVQDENARIGQLLEAPLRKPACRIPRVAVSLDGKHRRDAPELLEHRLAADVSGVDDRLRAHEKRLELRIEKAMRIRDDAELHAVRGLPP